MSTEKNFDSIKKLRELTGAGFKDCNNALKDSNGDLEKSIEYLRIKGISKASKKMERSAKEGLICIYNKDSNSSIIEINCETDFVAKNDEFIKFCEEISEMNFNEKGIVENLKNSNMKNGTSVDENLVKLIAKIGEKITISKSDYINNVNLIKFSYTHNSIKENIGKLGVLVGLNVKQPNKEIEDFGKKLAMHIAASNPLAIDVNEIDNALLSKEEEMISEEMKNSDKPNEIVAKISKGRLEKFKQENTLLNQPWVMDPKKKVREVLKELNNDVSIKSYIRYKIGE